MNIKICKSRQGSNKGTCAQLVAYLEKENNELAAESQRYFFSQEAEFIMPLEVQNQIDKNHAKLNKNESKYFMIIISPSAKELLHIGCSEENLKEYARSFMDEYAQNFNKGHMGKDLVWFGKVEEFRENKKEKIKKQGPQWHIHIIVSRMDKAKKHSLSPLTNHRNTTRGAVKGGFDRNTIRGKSEKIFDQLFEYNRSVKETWEYQNALKKEKRKGQNYNPLRVNKRRTQVSVSPTATKSISHEKELDIHNNVAKSLSQQNKIGIAPQKQVKLKPTRTGFKR